MSFLKSFFLLVFSFFFISMHVKAQQNIALGKRAYQSSTIHGARASRAVDGTTNGLWHNNSVSSTQKENRPWWEVDLEAEYEITSIVIYNRTDGHTERLNHMNVYISGAGKKEELVWSPRNGTPGFKTEIYLEGGKTGRFVSIKLPGHEQLSLAEVKVYGYRVGEGTLETSSSKKTGSRSSHHKVQLYTSSLY